MKLLATILQVLKGILPFLGGALWGGARKAKQVAEKALKNVQKGKRAADSTDSKYNKRVRDKYRK